ncbi:MAG: hypothetical protein IKV81_03680 [Clostridia bacterium]|nr:hypothetical protein [Clostridia bacterium]
MKFPKLRPQGAKVLKVPDLAGGLNLRDGVSEVLDNQLTQAKNVWFQDGVLKTRPGIMALNNKLIGRVGYRKVFYKLWSNIKYQDYVLMVVQKDTDYDNDGIFKTDLSFYWQKNEEEISQLPAISFLEFDEQITYFLTQNDNAIYLFTSNYQVYKLEYSEDKAENRFEFVPEEDYYVPLVVTNCKADGSFSMEKDEVMSSGVQFEGYNLLSDYYKISYTAYNPVVGDGWEKGHKMRYSLLHSCNGKEYKGMTVTAELTTKTATGMQTVTHEIVLEGETSEWVTEAKAGADGLKLSVFYNQLFFRSEDDTIAYITKENEGLIDNLVIKAPYLATDEEKDKIFKMTQCEWFGGGTAGIEGGTRLFLGGNTSKGNENLVVWSDLNNPLYFSENNYFRVGESSTAVTSFGKQADMLIIFKENGSGIFYTKYQQNTDITAENLINQSVVDYVASSVYFPLVQINPNVGCSHPETIQLCRNRLVWLGDNGNVYTLVNESQYNERSVFCVSEMVARDLKQNIDCAPTACDWNGYYCIMSGNKLYLMDYNCYGYTHVASYSKTEDANIRIPWYIWELPLELDKAYICELDGKILFSSYYEGEGFANCCILNHALAENNLSVDKVFSCLNENGYEDLFEVKERPILTTLRTKLFTFGEASTRKNIDKINLQLGNNGGEPITVKVITDQSQEEHDIYLNGTETQAYTPGYIDSKAIFPCARNVLRIGLELSSQGVIAVDGMEIKYRTTGGAR